MEGTKCQEQAFNKMPRKQQNQEQQEENASIN